jgi:hypothetical protein
MPIPILRLCLAITALLSFFYPVSAQQVNPSNYTIINGQIFTPGLAIVDAPQPNTPLGGGTFLSPHSHALI